MLPLCPPPCPPLQALPDPNPGASGAGAEGEQDEELLEAQAYIRRLHAYLEPRMLRRMKATALREEMPPKITRCAGGGCPGCT